MDGRRQESDYYHRGYYRSRSPAASRYYERSPEKYRDRSGEAYRSSRHRDRSRSRSGSNSRSGRADRYRSKSRSRYDRSSTSRSRYRSSRSRSPCSRTSSRHYASKSRHRDRSRSRSLTSPHTSREHKSRRLSPETDRVAPPPPTFSRRSESSEREDASNSRDADVISNTIRDEACNSETSPTSNNPEVTNSEASNAFEEDFDPIDKERIHREMEEKLRLALAKEGKVYPPPKPEASHPVFANDGSFLEIFKKMQEQMAQQQANAAAEQRKNQPLCKRRGGKILKTGVVAKTRTSEGNGDEPKDFWSIYLQEVKKYNSSSCDVDSKTRPLVK